MEKKTYSWSILSAWCKKDLERVTKMLMKVQDSDMYMEDGIRVHDIIAQKKLVLLPPRFQDPKTGQWEDRELGINTWNTSNTKPIEVFDWLNMSMIADYLDPVKGILIDWKSGSRKSSEHSKMQLYVYAYLLSLIGIEIKVGIIAKVDELPEGAIICTDYSVYKINEEKLEVGRDYIEGNASELADWEMSYQSGGKELN